MLFFPNHFDFQICFGLVLKKGEANPGIKAETAKQFDLAEKINPCAVTVQAGDAEGAQHVVFIQDDAAVIVVAVEQGITEGEGIGLVGRLEGDIMAK